MEFLSTLNYFDIIIVVVVLLLGIKGFVQGFIKEFFTLLGLVIGVYLASHFAEDAAIFIDKNIFQYENVALLKLLGFMVILTIIWVGFTIVGSVVASMREEEGQHIIGRFLGFVAATTRYFFIFALIVTALSNVSLVKENLEKYLTTSQLYTPLKKVGSFLINIEEVDVKALKKEKIDDINQTTPTSDVNQTEQNRTI